jgi:GAF domain-containing protein
MQCSKCGAEITASTDPAILAAENARLARELAESRQQQAATGEILGIISRSPTDLQPVLDAVAESAARLCEALDASIWRLDGDRLRLVAHHGPIPQGLVGEHTIPLVRDTVNGRAVLEQRTVHLADQQTEAEEFPEGSKYARQRGIRTILSLPLLRKTVAIGTIALRRAEAELFTEWQVALLQTFANQAVIAIENARLFEAEQTRTRELTERTRELAESLEYQTAISEVLNVISRSPNELQPVLDTIVQTARRLCGAERAAVTMLRDGKYHLVAHVGMPPDYVEYLTRNPFLPDGGSAIGRVALERKAVQIPNVLVDPDWTGAARHRVGKVRMALGVPLLRKGEVIGVIAMAHTEVKPFTEKQIQPVSTFADQAVIAIVQTAGRLCQTERAKIWRLRDGQFQLVATTDPDAAFAKYLSEHPISPDRRSLPGRAALERRAMHMADVYEDAEISAHEQIRAGKARTMLCVPLLREKEAIGVITLHRTEVHPFTDKQIELVSTFADRPSSPSRMRGCSRRCRRGRGSLPALSPS